MSSSLCPCTCCAWEKEGAMVGTRIFRPASASWPCRPAPHRNTSHFPPRCQSWSWTQTWKMEERIGLKTDVISTFSPGLTSLLLTITLQLSSLLLMLWFWLIETLFTPFYPKKEQIFCDCLTVSQWPLALFLQSEALVADEPEVSISTSYVALLSSY